MGRCVAAEVLCLWVMNSLGLKAGVKDDTEFELVAKHLKAEV